jgi:hypothetical protein
LTAGYDNSKKLGGNCHDSVPLQLQFPKGLCRCCIRPLIREIRGKSVAVSVAVSDPITEIRGKAVAVSVAVSDPITKIRGKLLPLFR